MRIVTTLSVTDDDGHVLSSAREHRQYIPGASAQALLVEADTMQSGLLLRAVADLTKPEDDTRT